LADWDLCVGALAAQAPWWDSRTSSGYHLVTQGYLIGELVRRITGTSFAEFFKSEVTDVLDADFHVGLPESEESRVSFVIPGDGNVVDGLETSSIAYRSWTSPPVDFAWPRQRWWREAEIPASNGHGNARSVALIQSIIASNGEFNGNEVLLRGDRRANLRDASARRRLGARRRDELWDGLRPVEQHSRHSDREGASGRDSVHWSSSIKTSVSRLPTRPTRCSSCRAALAEPPSREPQWRPHFANGPRFKPWVTSVATASGRRRKWLIPRVRENSLLTNPIFCFASDS
jgi:CubicO group peptidase (beta-lactamase class C family)